MCSNKFCIFFLFLTVVNFVCSRWVYDEAKYQTDPEWKGRIPAWIGRDGRMRIAPSHPTTKSISLYDDEYGIVVPFSLDPDDDPKDKTIEEFIPSMRRTKSFNFLLSPTCHYQLCLDEFLSPSIVNSDGSDIFQFDTFKVENVPENINYTDVDLSPDCYFEDPINGYLICNTSDANGSIPKPLPTGTLSSFEMVNTALNTIRNGDFQGLNVAQLILDDNSIRNVLPSAFAGVRGLEKLSLERNQINFLDLKMFKGLDELLFLSFKGNNIHLSGYGKTMPNSSLSHNSRLSCDELFILPKLRYFNMADNPITALNQYIFWHLSQSPIEELNLRSCNLSTIHQDAFAPLTSLRHVDFYNNSLLIPYFITGINSNVAPPLLPASVTQVGLGGFSRALQQIPYFLISESVTVINLSANYYPQLTVTLLRSSLSAITTLVMEKCGIKSIGPNAFNHLNKLAYLYLGKNPITTIPPNVFPPSLNLLSLYQETPNFDNQIVFNFNLSGMSQLNWLDMNLLNVGELKQDAFAGADSLNFLQLRGSGVTRIAPAAFSNLGQLWVLDLGRNPDIILPPSQFSQGLDRLFMLGLDNSALDFKADRDDAGQSTSPFNGFSSLKMLFLHNNEIRQLDADLLTDLTNLNSLVLSNNKLTTWQIGTLVNMSSQLAITLSNNKISFLPNGTFEEFANILAVDLSDNAFICSCQLYDLQRLAAENSTSVLYWEDLNKYTCIDVGGSTIKKIQLMTQEEFDCSPKEQPPVDNNSNSSTLLSSIIGSVVAVTFVVCTAGTCYYKRTSVRKTWYYYKYGTYPDDSDSLSSSASSSLSTQADYEYDAFISFNEQDRSWVYTHLVPNLERNNKSSSTELPSSTDASNHPPSFRLCLHDRDFTVGQRITDNIIENISKSRKVLIVLSRSYVESKWCQFELHLSQHRLLDTDRRDALVLVVLEDVPKQQQNAGLRYLIRTRTYLAWRPDIEGQRLFWRRLYDFLNPVKS